MEDLEVDGPVAVDDPVPQPARLLPGDVRELLFEVGRKLRCGFAKHGEVPQ
jgi:hypothetical protein